MLKRAKYHNIKTATDGISFDSKKEMQVYLRLKDMLTRGLISNLELQPKWVLQPKLKEIYIKHLKTKDKVCERTILLPITYAADFAFDWNGERIYLDVKASKSMLPKEYALKKKMLRYVHGITITEVFALKDLNKYEQI